MKLSFLTLGFMFEKLNAFEAGLAEQQTLQNAFRELLKTAAQAGFSHADLSSRELDAVGMDFALQALEDYGMTMGCLIFFDHEMLKPGVPYPIENCVQAITDAKKLGAEYILLVPRILLETRALQRQRWIELMANNMSLFAKCAAEAGITVVVENRQDIELPLCSARELDILFEHAEDVMLCYDSANMLFSCEEPLKFYDHFRERIRCIHLKDVAQVEIDAQRGNSSCDGRRLAPVYHGNGLVDFSELAQRMRKEMPKGIVTVEYMPEAGEDAPHLKVLPELAVYFRGLLAGE